MLFFKTNRSFNLSEGARTKGQQPSKPMEVSKRETSYADEGEEEGARGR